ncbi:MAG TPA: hypothetical protein VLA98_06545 [Solirubrobacteraceae bacterium]|nr:hypothetical protein [Solirubrobacteraceae bacterium]
MDRALPTTIPATAVLAATAAALAAAAPAGAAAWRAEALPGGGSAAGLLGLAFAADGTGLVTWEGLAGRRFTAVQRRADDGAWVAARRVAGLGWGGAQLHPYARARTLLFARRVTSFGRFHRARFALVAALGRSDDGTTGRLRTVARSASAFASAVDRAGDAVAAWTPQRGRGLFVAERRAGGRIGTPRRLARPFAVVPAAAMNDRGDRVVAWGANGRLYARVRRAGGPWGSAQRVAGVQLAPGGALAAAMTPAGRAVLAWETADVREGRPVRIVAGGALARRPAGRSWRVTTLERATLPALAADARALPLVDARGVVRIAWTGAAGAASVVKVAALRPGGAGAPVVLSPGARTAALDDVAADRRGALAASWSETTPAGGATTSVALKPRAGGWRPPDVVSPPGGLAGLGSRIAFQPLTGEPVAVFGVVAPGGTGTLAAASAPPPG